MNTHTDNMTSTTEPTRADAWRDVWSDDREANRVAARIAQSREDAADLAEFLARARAATS
jgi:hypothetical protein